MSDVWRYSKATKSDRLVLLAIADIANDDGECTAYGRSVAKIAEKTLLSDSTIRSAIRALQDLGELRVVEGGGRKSNDYFVTLTPPGIGGVESPEGTPPNAGGHPAEDSTPAPQTSEGRLSVPVRPRSSSPSSTPPPATGTRIPDPFLVTEDLWRWSDEQQFSREWVRGETSKFVDYWRGAAGAKARKVDWPATWRNWIRTASERVTTRPGGFTPRPNVVDRNAENAAEALRLMGGTGS